MAVIAWPIAFGLVFGLLSVFKDQLPSLSLALRALLVSGALVSVMAIVVMPVITAVVSRRLGGPAPKR